MSIPVANVRLMHRVDVDLSTMQRDEIAADVHQVRRLRQHGDDHECGVDDLAKAERPRSG
ncbi:hypothetical protein [Rhodopila sp.]|uniref:hypothetical protein n=1 Tax=Rhodopila sp. TaxID=2480087 RepID=UPI003D0BAF5D